MDSPHGALFVSMAVVAGVLLVPVFVYIVLSPWRTILAWAATLSMQLDFGPIHLGVSDAFAVPLAVWAVLLAVKKGAPVTPVLGTLLLFAGTFCTWSNLVATLNLGYLPKWTYLNKDLGLIEMVICTAGIIFIVDSRIRVKGFVTAFLIGGSIANAIALGLAVSSVLVGFGGFVMYGYRFTGFRPNPNAWSCYVATLALFQLSLLLMPDGNASRGRRVLEWTNLALLTLSVIVSMSRSGFLVIALGGICMLPFLDRRRMLAAVRALVLFLGLATVLLWSTGLTSFLAARLSEPENVTDRWQTYKAGWNMYTDSAISVVAGIGVGTFVEKAPATISSDQQIHNTFLWLLVEGGPFLLFLFLLGLGLAFYQCLRIVRTAPGLRVFGVAGLCALAGFITFLSTNEGLYQHELWLLLALPDVVILVARKTGFRIPGLILPSLVLTPRRA